LPDPEAHPLTWELFRKCRPLGAVSAFAMQEVFAAADERTFQPGDVMIKQGDPPDGLLIMLEGTAHAQLSRHDGDHWLGSFKSGDLAGEMALVTREARSANVIADSPVRALLVPTAEFDRLAVRHLELGLVLTNLVADRLGRSMHDGFGDKRIEGFRILRCIGRGGMSVVYQAQEQSTGEIVALKMMSYRLIYDAAALARFHQESELHQSLDHDNIARLKRLFPAYRTYFLVMELCEGMDLRRLVWLRGRLPEAQVRAILGQLASALEYVHERGLVHRDLKPANVMITRDGRVKLTDFGLAMPVVPLDGGETRAVDDSVMGTPAFMAPEQLARGPLDRRTDVYALGCLAYELLSGSALFVATDLFGLVQEKAALQLPPAASIGEGVSEELYEFLRAAVRVNPNDRPSSTAALVKWAAPCEPPPVETVGEPPSDDTTV
jgi:CRP-like cAMP-binding protein